MLGSELCYDGFVKWHTHIVGVNLIEVLRHGARFAY